MNLYTPNSWAFHCPTKIIFGLGSRENLASVIGDGPCLIVTSARGRASASTDPKLRGTFKGPAIWIDDVQPNPDLTAIERQVGFIEAPIESVVAIGGGSSIDAAKSIVAALSCRSQGARLKDLIENPDAFLKHRSSRLIALPTTAGTGSEVTPFATVWDHHSKKKMSLAHSMLFPDIAIIDPELTFQIPKKVTIATGFDALNQALESVWNKNATPYTRQLAARAVGLAVNALSILGKSDESVQARVDMSEASLLAGICISQTRTAICHSISYPLTAHFDMPHGLACAFTMRAVADEVARADPSGFEKFTNLAGFGSLDIFFAALNQLYDDCNFDGMAALYLPSEEALFSLLHEMITPGRSGNFTIGVTEGLVSRILVASLKKVFA